MNESRPHSGVDDCGIHKDVLEAHLHGPARASWARIRQRTHPYPMDMATESIKLAKMVPLTACEIKRRLVPNWRKLETMLTHFPKAVPEIPVCNVEKAAEYYVNVLGFQFDWGNEQDGIGGISQGSAVCS